MDIQEVRLVVRAKRFERTCGFYGGTLAFPEIGRWESGGRRGARFQAGPAVVEVVGRVAEDPLAWDEEFDYVGPQHKLTLTFVVPSAEEAYRTLHFRDKNVPGGLRADETGAGGLVFETHDPDGVKILFREGGG
jgi:catechol 2,3-dioxygenase-like lactoylglutathione lyase family enzyme